MGQGLWFLSVGTVFSGIGNRGLPTHGLPGGSCQENVFPSPICHGSECWGPRRWPLVRTVCGGLCPML